MKNNYLVLEIPFATSHRLQEISRPEDGIGPGTWLGENGREFPAVFVLKQIEGWKGHFTLKMTGNP